MPGPIPLKTFTADVMVAGAETGCKADLVVVDVVGRTLLCRETAVELVILHIGPVQANSVSGGIGSDICGRYSDLINGVGLLKRYELKLHFDESVKPVAQHGGRVPLGLREKINWKLDEVLET